MLCPCGCGQEAADTFNPANQWSVARSACNARQELIDHQKAVADANEANGDKYAQARLWSIEKKR